MYITFCLRRVKTVKTYCQLLCEHIAGLVRWALLVSIGLEVLNYTHIKSFDLVYGIMQYQPIKSRVSVLK